MAAEERFHLFRRGSQVPENRPAQRDVGEQRKTADPREYGEMSFHGRQIPARDGSRDDVFEAGGFHRVKGRLHERNEPFERVLPSHDTGRLRDEGDQSVGSQGAGGVITALLLP